MATTLEVIRRVTLEAKERGITELTGKLEKLEKQYQDISAAGATTAKSTESAERAFTRHSRAVDENLRAMERFTTQAKAFADARAQGRITEQEHLRLLTLSEQQMRKTTGANDNFAKSATQLGKSTGLARHEMVNFSRQVQDIGVSLASGQGLFTVGIQQGTQLLDIFANSNTTLRGFAAQVGGFAARWAPVGAAIAAVAGTVVLLNREMEKNLETQRAMSGAGRFAGATPAGIAGAAERTAGAGVSLSSAREGVLAGVRAGVPGLDVIERANALAQRYAATIGIELPAAQKELAAALAAPGRGAEALDDKLKFLDATTIRYIKTLEAAGRRGEAARVILDNLLKPNVLVSQADAVNIWGQAWAFASTKMEEAANAYVKLIKGEMDWQKAALARGTGPLAPGIDPRGQRLTVPGQPQQQPDPRIAAVMGQRAPAIPDYAYDQGREAAAMSPQFKARLAAWEEEERRLNSIKLIIKDANQAYEDQVRVLNAVTVAQQAAAASTQTYNQLIRESKSEEEALAKARIAGNLVRAAVRAQDAHQAESTRTSGKDQLDLIRLETKLLGENATERNRQLEIRRGQQQAAEEEKRGHAENAEAIRKYTREIANANAELEKQRDIARLDPQGQYTARATGQNAEAVMAMRNVARQMSGTWRDIANGLHQGADGFNRFVDKFGNVVDDFGRTAQEAAEAMSFAVKAGTFSVGQPNMQLTTAVTGAIKQFGITSGGMATNLFNRSISGGGTGSDASSAAAAGAAASAQEQLRSRAMQLAQSQLSDVIAAARDRSSALSDELSKFEEQAETRRDALDRKIESLEGQMRAADRPDPYLLRNPEQFFRSGTSAFRENDPIARLLNEAMAERELVESQLDAQQEGVRLQQQAIEAEVRGLEEQARQLNRLSELSSAGVTLQAEEVAVMRQLVGAVGSLGTALMQSDYARMLAAAQTASTQISTSTSSGAGGDIPRTSTFAGKFQHGGIIPAGMWGIAGEAGRELIERPTAVRGPARVTPAGRPIVVNQMIVANAGRRELTQSRGEMAQRAAADLRRAMR